MNWLTSPRSCSRTQRADRGFTLIEILIAISILAVVLTTIYGMFSSVTSVSDRLEADSAEYHRARVIFDRLGRELRGTYDPPGAQQHVFHSGTSPEGEVFLELTTSAVSPLSDVGTGIALVRYTLAADRERGDGLVLLRSERPWHMKTSATSQEGMMRFVPGIDGMVLRFYANGDWTEGWDANNAGLPELVEITLQLGGSGRQTTFRSAFELPQRWLK